MTHGEAAFTVLDGEENVLPLTDCLYRRFGNRETFAGCRAALKSRNCSQNDELLQLNPGIRDSQCTQITDEMNVGVLGERKCMRKQ